MCPGGIVVPAATHKHINIVQSRPGRGVQRQLRIKNAMLRSIADRMRSEFGRLTQHSHRSGSGLDQPKQEFKKRGFASAIRTRITTNSPG